MSPRDENEVQKQREKHVDEQHRKLNINNDGLIFGCLYTHLVNKVRDGKHTGTYIVLPW